MLVIREPYNIIETAKQIAQLYATVGSIGDAAQLRKGAMRVVRDPFAFWRSMKCQYDRPAACPGGR